MKKHLLSLGILALSLTSVLAGCSSGGGSEGGEPQDPIDLGSSFNAEYYPKKSENIVKSLCNGKKKTITLALNYEGNDAAWIELAKEYERLSGNWVTVDVKTFANADLYTQNLQQQESNTQTEWDIVSGNLLANATKSAYNLQGLETSKNPYMGNKKWSDALETSAYKGDSTYSLNTENLLTAWFVNKNATTAAGIADKDVCPTTWEGLLANLEALKKVGYRYPLGLSLNNDSVRNSQFAWLLRIYGDYYFRSYYKCINRSFDQKTGTDKLFTYRPEDQDIESDKGLDRSYSRMFATMMDENSGDFFCGPTSDVYTEFLNQFFKLKEYIDPSASSYTFTEVRSHFMAQAMGDNGKESPQIMLDYTGKGLQFMDAERLKGQVEFFDYPKMTSSGDFIPANTVVRDVGGSGGYLAIFSCRGKEQIDLDKDFLKFVASPYGQSIYYKALSNNNLAPQGLTTVKNDLVVIPESWVTFFKSGKVTNTGKADKNKYLTYGVLGFDKRDYKNTAKDTENAPTMWRKLLLGDGSYTIANYSKDWKGILIDAYTNVHTSKGWPADGYSYDNFDNASYIKDIMN